MAENVSLPGWVRGLPDAAELLEAFDLVHLADHLTGQASRGEQQRVAIARAAALGPVVIVLDEPTSHQDEAHADLVAQPAARAGPGRAVRCSSPRTTRGWCRRPTGSCTCTPAGTGVRHPRRTEPPPPH